MILAEWVYFEANLYKKIVESFQGPGDISLIGYLSHY